MNQEESNKENVQPSRATRQGGQEENPKLQADASTAKNVEVAVIKAKTTANIAELILNIAELKAKNADLEVSVKAKTAKIAELIINFAELKAKNADLEVSVKAKTANIAELKAKNVELEVSVKAKTANIAELEFTAVVAKAYYKGSHSFFRAKIAELEDTAVESDMAHELAMAYQDGNFGFRMADMEVLTSDLSKENAELAKENAELRQKNDDLSNANDGLKADLEKANHGLAVQKVLREIRERFLNLQFEEGAARLATAPEEQTDLASLGPESISDDVSEDDFDLDEDEDDLDEDSDDLDEDSDDLDDLDEDSDDPDYDPDDDPDD